MDILQTRARRQEKHTVAVGRHQFSLGKVVAWGFLALWIFVTLFPVYWIGRMAFSTQKSLLANPTTLGPADFTLDAFARVLGLLPLQTFIDHGGYPIVIHFGLYLSTTLLMHVLITVGSTVFNAMAAYAFARLRFPLRDKVFYLYLI